MSSYTDISLNKISLNYTYGLSDSTEHNEWIYITNYDMDKRQLLFVSKSILKNKEDFNFSKHRNIYVFELPSFNDTIRYHVYNKKIYTTVYYSIKNTSSHFCF